MKNRWFLLSSLVPENISFEYVFIEYVFPPSLLFFDVIACCIQYYTFVRILYLLVSREI